MYPCLKRIRSVNSQANWTYVSPRTLMRCTHKCKGSWQVSLQGHSQESSLKYNAWEKCLKTAGKKMSLLSSRRVSRRTQVMADQSASPWSGNMREKLTLETVSMHMKDKKIVRRRLHGFTRGCWMSRQWGGLKTG